MALYNDLIDSLDKRAREKISLADDVVDVSVYHFIPADSKEDPNKVRELVYLAKDASLNRDGYYLDIPEEDYKATGYSSIGPNVCCIQQQLPMPPRTGWAATRVGGRLGRRGSTSQPAVDIPCRRCCPVSISTTLAVTSRAVGPATATHRDGPARCRWRSTVTV